MDRTLLQRPLVWGTAACLAGWAGGVVLSFVLFGDPRHKDVLTIIAIALMSGGLAVGLVSGVATYRYNQVQSGGKNTDKVDARELQAEQTRLLYLVLTVTLLVLGCLATGAWLLYVAADGAAAILGAVVLVAMGACIFQYRRMQRSR